MNIMTLKPKTRTPYIKTPNEPSCYSSINVVYMTPNPKLLRPKPLINPQTPNPSPNPKTLIPKS